MIRVLRQLAMIFIVTLVSMGVTASAGNASMDLKCDMMLTAASADSSEDHSQHRAGDPSDHSLQNIVIVEDHIHDEDTSSEEQGSHCKAHACPITALLASSDVAQAFLFSHALYALRTAPLVDLTFSERLRRPPRV